MNNRRDPTDDPEFYEAVRLTAYFLWEQDGRPEGRAEEYWRRALEKHRAERMFDRWLDEDPGGEKRALGPDGSRRID